MGQYYWIQPTINNFSRRSSEYCNWMPKRISRTKGSIRDLLECSADFFPTLGDPLGIEYVGPIYRLHTIYIS